MATKHPHTPQAPQTLVLVYNSDQKNVWTLGLGEYVGMTVPSFAEQSFQDAEQTIQTGADTEDNEAIDFLEHMLEVPTFKLHDDAGTIIYMSDLVGAPSPQDFRRIAQKNKLAQIECRVRSRSEDGTLRVETLDGKPVAAPVSDES